MAVDPRAKKHSGAAKGADVRKAVAEVTLRRGAQADARPHRAQEHGFVIPEVRRVHGDEAIAQNSLIGQELDGALSGLRQAGGGISAPEAARRRACARALNGVRHSRQGARANSEARRAHAVRSDADTHVHRACVTRDADHRRSARASSR